MPRFKLSSNPAHCIGMIVPCASPGCKNQFKMNSPTHKYCSDHSSCDVYAYWLPRNWMEIERKMQQEHIKKLNTIVWEKGDPVDSLPMGMRKRVKMALKFGI